MKKTRFLALALVVAIALMGAGYAWWNDYTKIDATVGTGNMDVIVRWASITKPPHVDASITGGRNANQDERNIVVNVSKLYPTVYNGNDSNTFVRIHFAVENHGTVPVKLEDIVFTQTNPTSPVWDHLKTSIHMHQGGINGHNGTSTPTNIKSLTGVNPIGSHQNVYLKDIKAALLASDLANTVLMPNETIWFGGPTEEESSIRFWLDKSAPPETQSGDASFELEFKWKQYNQP